MQPIKYIERTNGKVCLEEVYGGKFLKFLYENPLGIPAKYLLSSFPFFSQFYGWLQKRKSSAKKIAPFVKKYHIDCSEFADISTFHSFNDFFIRHLKPTARPINQEKATAVIPADGRYLFLENINQDTEIVAKGTKFNLAKLLQNPELASEYNEGSMVIARLCPVDYHRYHFPCTCIPQNTQEIKGKLYSVNPIAIKKHLDIYWENKRTLCELMTEEFGKVLLLEIGATFVGSIHQTYTPFKHYAKGDEKGFFSFGGSCLILLFQKDKIKFDEDLLQASKLGMEIRCLMGQSMGKGLSLS